MGGAATCDGSIASIWRHSDRAGGCKTVHGVQGNRNKVPAPVGAILDANMLSNIRLLALLSVWRNNCYFL